jgi:WhiB family redox-sensing transcriptional regulator
MIVSDAARATAAVRSLLRTVLFAGGPVPSWHERAACASAPTSMFFPETGGTLQAVTVRAAKRVCAGCVVREQCLADVLAYESRAHRRYGVAGGTSAAQRSQRGGPRP